MPPTEQDKTAQTVNGFIIREEYSPNSDATNTGNTLKQLFDFEMVDDAVSPGSNERDDNYQATEPALTFDDFVCIHPHNV